MNKFNLIRNISLIALAVASGACLTVAGVKAGKTIQAANDTNSYTAQINDTMRKYKDYKKKGTEGYLIIQDLTAKRETSNSEFQDGSVGLTATAISGTVCLFALIYVAVNTTKASD